MNADTTVLPLNATITVEMPSRYCESMRSATPALIYLSRSRLLLKGCLFVVFLIACLLFEPMDLQAGDLAFTGPLNIKRYHHTSTLLPNGKVLIAGGYNNVNGYLASAEIYDPATGSCVSTTAMNYARGYHTATLLPNGKVFVA